MGNENCCGPNEENGERNNPSAREIIQARRVDREEEHEKVNFQPSSGIFLAEKYQAEPKVIETTRTDQDTQREKQYSPPNLHERAEKKKLSSTYEVRIEGKASQHLVEKPEILLPDGSRYQGQWNGEKKEGKGKIYYSDGSVYEGNRHLLRAVLQ